MDGKGCWRGNVFVERLVRSVKYEEVYLHVYETMNDTRSRLDRNFSFYNTVRPHHANDGRWPDDVYGASTLKLAV